MTKSKDLALSDKGNSNSNITTTRSFRQHAGEGLENITSADISVPRLTILQKLSPQLDRGNGEFIEGAAEGDICNTGLRKVFKDGVIFMPVMFRKEFLEWRPNRGGYAGKHLDPSIMGETTRDENNRPVLSNGNIIAETAQFYGFNLSADRQMCFVPMASTQLKQARNWNSLILGQKELDEEGEYTPPMYFRSYRLGTKPDRNDKGTFFSWTIESGQSLTEIDFGIPWESVEVQALKFLEQLRQGEADADSAEAAATADAEAF